MSLVFRGIPGLLLASVSGSSIPGGAVAMMQRVGGCVRIAVSRDAPKREQRFGIAHEIGHALLHSGHIPGVMLRQPERAEYDVKEAQAEYFATELLAPIWAVEKALPTWALADDVPEKEHEALGQHIARCFDIPDSAGAERLQSYYLVARRAPLFVVG